MSEANEEFDNRGRAQELKLRTRRKNIQSILREVTTRDSSAFDGSFLMVAMLTRVILLGSIEKQRAVSLHFVNGWARGRVGSASAMRRSSLYLATRSVRLRLPVLI